MAKKADLGKLVMGIGNRQVSAPADANRIVNIIEFVEEVPWGIRQRLFPVQRVVLKAHYGIPLDDNPWGVDLNRPVPLDHPAYHEIANTSLNPSDPLYGFYKWRVPITNWRRQNAQVFSEAGYLRYLHDEGRCNIREVEPGRQLRNLWLALGRRSGKSEMVALVKTYEIYRLIRIGNPQAYYGLPAGENIQFIVVSVEETTAELIYKKMLGYIQGCTFFQPYLARNTTEVVTFQTPEDVKRFGSYADDEKAKASIEVTFHSSRGRGLRGPGNLIVALDEIAHFVEEGASSAKTVYDAITPSTATFSQKDPLNKERAIGDVEGRVLAISSPLGQSGFFYEQYQLAMRGGAAGSNDLAIQAPSWEVNPTVPASFYEEKYAKDPATFFTEYGAEFSNRTRGWIEVREDLLACVVNEMRPMQRGMPMGIYYCGVDVGLSPDGTAIAIGHLDPDRNIVVDVVDGIIAGQGNYAQQLRLDFDEAADWIFGYSQRFSIAEGICDQWSGAIFEQAMLKRGLNQIKRVNMTPVIKSQIWRNFKDWMIDGRLVLYDWPKPTDRPEGHCEYIEELLDLQVEYKSKYLIDVFAPKTPGKHDDMSDALARMVWVATQAGGKNPAFATGVRPGQGAATLMGPRRARPAGRSPLMPGGIAPMMGGRVPMGGMRGGMGGGPRAMPGPRGPLSGMRRR